jgi:hypothetical protein
MKFNLHKQGRIGKIGRKGKNSRQKRVNHAILSKKCVDIFYLLVYNIIMVIQVDFFNLCATRVHLLLYQSEV